MSYFDMYKDRLMSQGRNRSERIVKTIEKNFEKTLAKDPASMLVPVTIPGEVNVTDKTRVLQVIINDFSNNDQKAFDEKWLFARLEDDVDLGCYVWWDNSYWLINFKESNSINAYKKFIMKKCNQIFKFKWNNIIYEIPAVVKNLTQYSDGMQDIVYTSMPDNKLSIMYGLNSVTQNIRLDNRIMINKEKSYRVTLVENYQYNSSYDEHSGIASSIIVHTALRDTDDADNNLADNNEVLKPLELHIEGLDKVMPGGRFKYKLSEVKYTEWGIEYIGDARGYVTLKRSGDDCILEIKPDMDLIGNKFKLISLNNVNLPQAVKEISVRGV